MDINWEIADNIIEICRERCPELENSVTTLFSELESANPGEIKYTIYALMLISYEAGLNRMFRQAAEIVKGL